MQPTCTYYMYLWWEPGWHLYSHVLAASWACKLYILNIYRYTCIRGALVPSRSHECTVTPIEFGGGKTWGPLVKICIGKGGPHASTRMDWDEIMAFLLEHERKGGLAGPLSLQCTWSWRSPSWQSGIPLVPKTITSPGPTCWDFHFYFQMKCIIVGFWWLSTATSTYVSARYWWLLVKTQHWYLLTLCGTVAVFWHWTILALYRRDKLNNGWTES